MPKKPPKVDAFRPTKVKYATLDGTREYYLRPRSDKGKESAAIDATGGKPFAGRMLLRWRWKFGSGVEWPRDDSLNAFSDGRRKGSTYVCTTCGHTAHLSARRSAHRDNPCPQGCGPMACFGMKLRVPRKKKLLKWLKKQRKAQR